MLNLSISKLLELAAPVQRENPTVNKKNYYNRKNASN